MHPYHPPPYPGWQQQSDQSSMNGHSFEIARSLGRLEAQGERQVEILLGMQSALHQIPQRIAAELPSAPATPAKQEPPQSVLAVIVKDRWWLATLWVLTLIVLKVLGVISAEQLTWLLGQSAKVAA